MNNHFSREPSEYTQTYPRQAYARIDYVENDADLAGVTIGFDSVSCETADRLLGDLQPDDWRTRWETIFAAPPPREGLFGAASFAELSLYHIEVTQGQEFVLKFLRMDNIDQLDEQWMLLELSEEKQDQSLSVAVFSGLFAEPRMAYLSKAIPVDSKKSQLLSSAFSMSDWPTSDVESLTHHFVNAYASIWNAYDVGQGSSNGFRAAGQPVRLMHDIGCGVYRNACTRPAGQILCYSSEATIVLSHWDTDHWAGASYFSSPADPMKFMRDVWIAPYDLTAGPRHIAFAVGILAAGGSLLIMPSGSWVSSWIALADGRKIRLIRGSGASRNGSGIAMEIADVDFSENRRWLLTGDVDYQYLQHAPLLESYVAMSVPHHGAKQVNGANIPSPVLTEPRYSRLIYSFGGSNSFGHPSQSSIAAHTNSGWNHGSWGPSMKANTVASGDVLATACNGTGPAHLGAISISWRSSINVPIPPYCAGRQFGCTVVIQQS